MADENGFNIIDQLNQRGGQQKTDASTSTTDFRSVWEKATQQELRYLQSIDKNVEAILKKGVGSQSAIFDNLHSRQDERNAEKTAKSKKSERSGPRRWDGRDEREESRGWAKEYSDFSKKSQEMFDEWSSAMEDALFDGLAPEGFRSELDRISRAYAAMLGVSIEDVGKEFANMAGKQTAQALLKTQIGQHIKAFVEPHLRNFATRAAQNAKNTNQAFTANMSHEERAAWNARIKHNIAWQNANAGTGADSGNDTARQTAQSATSSATSGFSSAQTVNIVAQSVNIAAASSQAATSSSVNWDEYVDVDAAVSPTDVPSGFTNQLVLPPASSGSDTTGMVDMSNQNMSLMNPEAFEQLDVTKYAGEISGALTALQGIKNASQQGLGRNGELSQGGKQIASGVADVGANLAAKGISAAATAAGVPIPPEVIAMLLKPVIEALIGPILLAFQNVADKFNEMKDDIGDAFNRSQKSAEKNQELAQKRLIADTESLIRAPFEIAKDAAEDMYQVWDNNLRKINATQGYDKAGLQSLIGAYAERLRSEGLTSAIGADDITENLSKVLETGMSGAIAEEFAYLATKLNAAIPTEDFFNYAATYSSVASQAMAAGMSQTEAISHANEQLEAFANNILYASRELSGGFTTGLANANDLFAKSTQIAQAAKVDNSTGISAVLTAVSSIAGAVAPDLANGLIEAVYSAAVGGNNSSIVALRSLAGINASNTEFLRQLATNPQRVFGDLFEGLGRMQSMSDDNYMEVAEALSDTFGVSMDAIARVDFNYLASAIRDMNAGSSALQQNIAHLTSGETTTSVEAMRMQQINEYMLEEGLAYVLDNEVARQIQQHMWDEQIARELMEARYSVDLVGSSLAFLQSIMSAVDTIMTILNPFRLLSKIGDLIATGAEASAQKADIRETLLLGKVGQGRASDFYNLTTRNADLELFNSYVSKQGGFSHYEAVGNLNALGKTVLAGMTGVFGDFDIGTNGVIAGLSKGLLDLGQRAAGSLIGGSRKPGSAYSWGQLGKSAASAISGTSYATNAALALAGSNAAQTSASTAAAQTAANDKLMKLLDTEFLQEKFVSQGKSYEDWVKYAKASGFSDIDAALSSAGLSAEDVKGQFNAIAGQEGSRIAEEDEKKQREMWEIVTFNLPLVEAYLKAQKEYQERFEVSWNDEVKWVHDTWELHSLWLNEKFDARTTQIDTKTTEIIAAIDRGIAKQDEMIQLNKTFFKSMTDNFLGAEGMTYSGAGIKYDEVNKIKQAEADEQSSAIYKLAEALTANTVDLTNPMVAQNAMLAQILKLVEIIVTQNSGVSGGSTIADSLIGLALGYTAPTA